MAGRKRAAGPSGPVSVVVSGEQRERLAAEARRRGLGVSPTIRTLALERLADIDEERQLARAQKWQLEQARRLVDEIARGGTRDVSQAEIDAIFDEASQEAKATSGKAPRAG